jgi:hypothetical protein
MLPKTDNTLDMNKFVPSRRGDGKPQNLGSFG